MSTDPSKKDLLMSFLNSIYFPRAKDEDEKMVKVTVRMTAAQRDRLTKQAEKSGVPMAEYVRNLLAKAINGLRKIF